MAQGVAPPKLTGQRIVNCSSSSSAQIRAPVVGLAWFLPMLNQCTTIPLFPLLLISTPNFGSVRITIIIICHHFHLRSPVHDAKPLHCPLTYLCDQSTLNPDHDSASVLRTLGCSGSCRSTSLHSTASTERNTPVDVGDKVTTTLFRPTYVA